MNQPEIELELSVEFINEFILTPFFKISVFKVKNDQKIVHHIMTTVKLPDLSINTSKTYTNNITLPFGYSKSF